MSSSTRNLGQSLSPLRCEETNHVPQKVAISVHAVQRGLPIEHTVRRTAIGGMSARSKARRHGEGRIDSVVHLLPIERPGRTSSWNLSIHAAFPLELVMA